MSKKVMVAMSCLAVFVWVSLGSALADEHHPPAQPGSPVRPNLIRGPDAFGGSLYTISSVSDVAFSPFNSSVPYSVNGSDFFKYATVVPSSFGATVILPAGAIIGYIGLDSCDQAGGNISAYVFRANADGSFDSVGNVASSAHGSTTPCAMDYTPPMSYQNVQNYGSSLQLEAFQTGVTDGSVRFGSIEIWWYTTVSPAPVTPSFNDVPASDPFFQYIEALKASGITGGCGDGTNFCPDQPVLRKQMAVFLAKALGLAWPF